ncbi:hypothetical protein [Parabacteroides sp. PF5-6]|uniref:hypothetical protein n=1 Tax=Parabacteroides sp. PF5-6 TaxID=1742403 RepID=UPI002406096F|nr:hypothetical protein [Parabacteroides sp. PF5-6]MDF9830009.1 hypothetical protein [Parabacteroides sp. PF5-6]
MKYGKYEMRIRDKILVENGHITKAKVKWWGMETYAYPYLWKENKSDTDYQKSWDDLKIKKDEKQENNQQQIPKKTEEREEDIKYCTPLFGTYIFYSYKIPDYSQTLLLQ